MRKFVNCSGSFQRNLSFLSEIAVSLGEVINHQILNYQHVKRKTCSYAEFFWSIFSHIRTEYKDLRSKSPYLVQMQENAEQKNSHFSRGAYQSLYR